MPIKNIVLRFWKDRIFMFACVAAIGSMFFIPPSIQYIGYINTKVLIGMFAFMIAVAGMYDANVFNVIASRLVRKFQTVRMVALIIIWVTYFLGMILTNDAVLITLVPFSIFVMKEIKQEKKVILLLVLQTIAANLGSALTPMGDPQNIYLYTNFPISFGLFIKTMLPITISGFVLVTILGILFFTDKKILPVTFSAYLKGKEIHWYFTILFLAIGCILGMIADWLVLIVVSIITLLFSKKLFARVDYPLLGTFFLFFVFTGNISAIESVRNTITPILSSKVSVYFTGLIVSQIISNVPATILLATFTDIHYLPALLQGVNVGAMGTIIGSLASLITYRYLSIHAPQARKQYLISYMVICIVFIFIITSVLFLLGSFQ